MSNLKDECLFRLEPELHCGLSDGLFKFTVSLSLHLQAWEQVSQQPQEDHHIISHYFRHVEVPQCTHQHLGRKLHFLGGLFRTIYLSFESQKGNKRVSHLILWSALVSSSQCPCHNQNRLDSTQPPIIVILTRNSKDE